QPVIAFLIEPRAVAGEIRAILPLAPVLAHEAIGIAVDAAQHRGPGAGQREQAAADLDALTFLIADLGEHARERLRARTRLQIRDPGKRRDHDHAGLRLPPRIHDGTSFVADVLVVPDPGFGIDWLTDRAEQAQR